MEDILTVCKYVKNVNIKEVKESFRTVCKSINKNNKIPLRKKEHSE